MEKAEILFQDHYMLVCRKAPGVLSTDEPGGLPSLLREQLGDSRACVRTVHRLDRAAGGVMVVARTRAAAAELSRQVREREMGKEYLAVVWGAPKEPTGAFFDLLGRSKENRRTFVADAPGKDVRPAELDYETLSSAGGKSLVRIFLHTGRTHQIRAQFSSRGMPLVGDRKYGAPAEEMEGISLWSWRLTFAHPFTGEREDFRCLPAGGVWEPWGEELEKLGAGG